MKKKIMKIHFELKICKVHHPPTSRSKALALECNSREAPASRSKTFQKQELPGNDIPKLELGNEGGELIPFFHISTPRPCENTKYISYLKPNVPSGPSVSIVTNLPTAYMHLPSSV